jgi:nucleosome assembly protein 1-like 1
MKEEVEGHEGDIEDEDHEDLDEGGEGKDKMANLLKDPQILAALQAKIRSQDRVEAHADYMKSLPASVKRRVKALKKLQLTNTNIEAQFYEEVHELEVKYQAMFKPQWDQRSKVVSGEHEPNDEECDFPSDEEEEDDEEKLSEDLKQKAKLEEKKKAQGDAGENVKGIPDFWFTILKNVDLLSEMIQEHDEPVLKHLTDVKVNLTKKPMGFTLEFHFSPNDYFTNAVLTKTYEMKCVPEEDDPFSFEGPEIVRCSGCKIDWKKGKNVTVRTVKKKQKHKGHGGVRMVSKTIPADSFFNFFDPPQVPEGEEAEDDMQQILTADFEIGHFLRERIVPRAVLYFTGEALEDEDEEYDDEDDDEEEEDDDDDEEMSPPKTRAPAGGDHAVPQNPQECKQQ